jgi:hypothetical protein
MFRFYLKHLQGASGTSKNQRYKCIVSYVQIWQYTYTFGFLKSLMLPENGFSKTKICWNLQRIYTIFFSFLIILKL